VSSRPVAERKEAESSMIVLERLSADLGGARLFVRPESCQTSSLRDAGSYSPRIWCTDQMCTDVLVRMSIKEQSIHTIKYYFEHHIPSPT